MEIPLGVLKEKFKSNLIQVSKPCINPPRRVPIALQHKIKEELTKMEKMGVIKKVTEPTEWVSSMVAVGKKNTDKLRICIDPRNLNQAIMREHYPLPTIDDITHKLTGAKVFSVLDAKCGYWHLRLDEASSKLTTFNSPFGRWRFMRMPFGIVSAQEIFQRNAHETLEGLKGVEVLIDDILVYGRTKKEHDTNLKALLERCKEKNMRLNYSKAQISVDKVSYFV